MAEVVLHEACVRCKKEGFIGKLVGWAVTVSNTTAVNTIAAMNDMAQSLKNLLLHP